MRPPSDPLVMAGPLYQSIRGLLLGVLLYFLREPFFHRIIVLQERRQTHVLPLKLVIDELYRQR